MPTHEHAVTLRFFGVGGAFSRRYGTTCSMLTLPDGKRWLIDCGRQAPEQLRAAGVTWHSIQGQIITHSHGDHVYGLEEFALTRHRETRGGVHAGKAGGPLPKLIAHSAVRDEVWDTLAPSLRYVQDGRGDLRSGTLGMFFEVVEPVAIEPPRANPSNCMSTTATRGGSRGGPVTPSSTPGTCAASSRTPASSSTTARSSTTRARSTASSIASPPCRRRCAASSWSCTTRTTSSGTVPASRPQASALRCPATSTTSCSASASFE